mmetsp:Transcript_36572/g.114588  ORF Transcript_36572/g.114588 Transcript_36572/m.114588 type:complete len:218 (-) Transcript_36572:14-667(-)
MKEASCSSIMSMSAASLRVTSSRSLSLAAARNAMVSATPSGLSSLCRIFESSESSARMCASSSSKPLASQSATPWPARGSVEGCAAFLARSALRALMAKTGDEPPRSAAPLMVTKSTTCRWSSGRSKRSILLMMRSTFLRQLRMRSRKTRSLSEKGRSADVTKNTRSARGMTRCVISSCPWMMALVPGVSTSATSSSHGAARSAISSASGASAPPAS